MLSAPPAFVLSQDQTLHENSNSSVEQNAGHLRPLLPFGIFHVYVPCRSWMRRTCCLRLTPPRGARSTSSTPKTRIVNSRIPQAQGPLRSSCSWQPDQFHPARRVSPARRGQSFNLSARLRPVNPSASTTFSLSQNQPRAELLEDTRVAPNRQGAFFRTFSFAPPQPPFRRQPSMISASPSGVNPWPGSAFGTASGGAG